MEANTNSPKTGAVPIDVENTTPKEVTRVNSRASEKAGIESSYDAITGVDDEGHRYLTGARLWLVHTGILL